MPSPGRVPPPGTCALRLRGVTRSFATPAGTVEAVRGVDLTVEPGEVLALLGPNGAGKTTTLDLVLGLAAPSAGSVEVFGSAPRRAVSTGRVAAVLQTGGLLRDLTVRETVELVASTYQEPRRRGRGREDHDTGDARPTATTPVEEVLERAGLTGLGDRRVLACSGGEQQRLRFALALLPDPDLLVLDEPTAGMDVTARREFWAAMHGEAAAGRTVVFATHHLEEADSFARRIVVMAQGRVVADGTTDQLRALTRHRTLRATVPGGRERAARVLADLRARPAVAWAEVDRDRLVVRASAHASDRLALTLLADHGLSDLEVLGGSLDDAFVALTREHETGADDHAGAPEETP